MSPRFYSKSARRTSSPGRVPASPWCAGLLFALLSGSAACGSGEATPDDGPGDEVYQAALPLQPYVPIPEGGMDERLIGKLRLGSKEALRFAKEALGEQGDAVVPALVAELEKDLASGATTATNLLSALVYTKTEQTLPILAQVMREHPTPLVRSQAIDSIGLLRQRGLESEVLEHAQFESEAGPASRIIPCVSALGGDASVEYLAGLVRGWVESGAGAQRGDRAWDALLTVDSPAARREIALLVDQMPPSKRTAGITRLIHLGAHELASEVREFLDPTAYPGPGTRHKAVEGLAVAGDFEGALLAREDPDVRVRLAVIDALALPAAQESDVGRSFLEEMARGSDDDLARAAIRVLSLRGDTTALEPWLALVRGYPTQPRSVSATRMFLHSDIGHPALTTILTQRWPYADTDQRIDLGRVMAAHADATSTEFLLDVVLDDEADVDVRLYSITSLGNSGEVAIDALFTIWKEKPGPAAMERLMNAFLRFPEVPRVREFLTRCATDPTTPDLARAQAIAGLPKAYGREAYPTLLEAWESAERDAVKQYIEAQLQTYF